jgi:hypothetical protein
MHWLGEHPETGEPLLHKIMHFVLDLWFPEELSDSSVTLTRVVLLKNMYVVPDPSFTEELSGSSVTLTRE